MTRPASLQSLTVFMFTASVILFSADGLVAGVPTFILFISWTLTALTAVGIYFLFTVLFVVFDNWCCYTRHASFDDYIYGRCTVKTAAIIHTPGAWHKCDSHSFTRSELIGIGVVCGLALLWLALFIVRLVLFKLSLPRISFLHRIYSFITHETTRRSYRNYTKNPHHFSILSHYKDQSHPALLFRIRFFLIFDFVSILFGFCAVVAKMEAWHVLLQVVLSMIALACAISYIFINTTVWMWWILVSIGGTATAALLIHHLYMSTVMIVFVHSAINNIIDSLNSRPPVKEEKMHAVLGRIHNDASDKAHLDATTFTTRHDAHESVLRPRLKFKMPKTKKDELKEMITGLFKS